MRTWPGLPALVIAVSLGLLPGHVTPAAPSGQDPATPAQDPVAAGIAKKTLSAMGGEEAFARLRTLRFEFVVDRGGKELARVRHVWDRADGRYRVEWKTKEGQSVLVLFNVNDQGKSGRAWLDGKELVGDDLASDRDHAYGRFINDTYWLLMPAKMLDPGVHLASEGEKQEDGKAYDVVRLTFDNVGLTPKDTYWAYVSKESGLMDRWDFVLQDDKPEDRSSFLWQDWRSVGDPDCTVRLAMTKKTPDGATAILFENVSGSCAADDLAFAP